MNSEIDQTTETTAKANLASAPQLVGPERLPESGPSPAQPVEPPPGLPEELLFESRRKITLRCGKSSITLHPNGKIVLRGEYILSDAEGINRIAGGHIELN